MEIPADLIIRIGDSIFPLHKVRTVVERVVKQCNSSVIDVDHGGET